MAAKGRKLPPNYHSVQSLLKDGTKHHSGVYDAVIRNIEAVKELSQVVRTSLGPNGMNKMVINQIEKLFVTNNASTIIRELDVIHPAAKMVVMAAKQQEQEFGDCANFVVIFAGELLQQAEPLLRMGLHVSDVVAGFSKAGTKALELLEGLIVDKCKDVTDQKEVERCIKTVVSSKQYGNEAILAPLIAKACIYALPKTQTRFNVDSVRVCKVLGGGVEDSEVIKGFAMPKDAFGTIKKVENAKVLILACGLEQSKTETKGTVLINTAQELLSYSKTEEEEIEAAVKAIADAGITVIVSGGAVSDLALHYVEKYNIMIVKEAGKFNLRRLCRAAGAVPLTRLGAPTPEEIGHCAEVSIKEIGSTKVCIFRQEEAASSGISTIIVRASTQNIMDDIERCVDNGVNAYKSLIRDGNLIPGAGAADVELARVLDPFGESTPGLDQYAIKKFAEALEVIPRTLSENAGASAIEFISVLNAAHAAGKPHAGVDIETCKTCNVVERGILDLYLPKAWALKHAIDVAITILRVDQIIMAKPAGGPKVPQQGARDM